MNRAAAGRPRLLFVGARFLFPADEGGKIRTASILRAMKGGAFELILASPAPPDIGAFRADIDGICDHFLHWPAPPSSTWRRLLALPGRVPVSAAIERSAAGAAVIAGALAGRPDVVVVDFPHTDVLMPRRIGPAGVLFTHNVEAEIFERHAGLATGLWRLVWRDQVPKMRAFEAEVVRRYDAVIAVSARDGEALRRRYSLPVVEAIDTGVDLGYFRFSAPEPDIPPAGGTVVFTGVMDSPANSDGIEYLMNFIWPLVLRARPEARALIVGRNPPRSLAAAVRARGLAWTVTGSVADIRPWVAQAHIAVIPLRVGSGTRIKAFEAMAMGRPVVSTAVGIEGLDVVAGEHYLLADDAEAFAAAILRLLDDRALRAAIAGAARARLEERSSWVRVARQFEGICQRALAARPGGGAPQ